MNKMYANQVLLPS